MQVGGAVTVIVDPGPLGQSVIGPTGVQSLTVLYEVIVPAGGQVPTPPTGVDPVPVQALQLVVSSLGKRATGFARASKLFSLVLCRK